ncbi:MAG: ATP-cone domain protein [Candidatus Kaiserbacteria bacterium GW2011_GWB1_52_6]|uniref:ATP-cone domain protein n=3 Tax=Candidatus Kaiseribacteriota TaxID=1752734 RepID=A0A0G2ADR0_9BACT|nr:MAG: ATP-cone domain protein [Candidatus Kaiserbacteria bacterium GW2011_GWA2_52_12]KKW28025.1 MAG: ATP-cone domain protein [Candidatus Kaiserbacteria bacterium GW2011_GWB1_52_6]KKW30584.1 MAG: ATP-cone domain protein [Candidatus Kaiserbacteria bacterium GW2011_GWC2_52_8b]
MPHILVTKADGEQEPFDAGKLEHSLELAGASSTTRARIVAHLIKEMHPGIMTEEIYQHAFRMLQEDEHTPVAARYSVKRAVFSLGPSGFPFEQFVAAILRAHGWHTNTGVALNGRCAPHEVDVLAEKDHKRVGIEAKFHNEPGGRTDIKDALYVKARYDDLRNTPEMSSRVDEGWLVTNTRFTRNAIRYAQCSGLTLIGWDYPRTRGLLTMIEEARVHPLTCLTTLSEGEKRRLLDQKIVLCKDVQTKHLLQEFGVRPEKIPSVIEEANRLCGI